MDVQMHTHQEPLEEDFYDDDADIFGVEVKTNIKKDPASVRSRPRLIPLGYLNIEDEDKIPAMPDPVPRPDDKYYERAIKEYQDKLDYHYKSINEIKEKICSDKCVSHPQMKEIHDEKEELYSQQKALAEEIKSLKEKLETPNREIAKLKEEKEYLSNVITTLKIENLTEEINILQRKIDETSLAEEKEFLQEKKAKLEREKPDLERYIEISQRIKAIHEEYKPITEKLCTLNKQRDPLSERIKAVKGKIDTMKTQAKETDSAVQALFTQVSLLREENRKCKARIGELKNEWNEKWSIYEKYEKMISYIQDAQDKIIQLKKKRKEDQVQIVISGEYDQEIASCQWLVEYFKNLSGIKDEQPKAEESPQEEASKKIDEDISSGLIVAIDRENIDNEFTIGTSEKESKKKTKKPRKLSKREQKAESSNVLVLDISVIQKIKDLQLTPPSYKSEVSEFIDKLHQKIEMFKAKHSETKTESIPAEVQSQPMVSTSKEDEKV